MASSTLGADCVRANHPSRRNILASLAVAPAAVAIGATAAGGRAGSEWSRAMRGEAAACAEMHQFKRDVLDPASRRWCKIAKSMPGGRFNPDDAASHAVYVRESIWYDPIERRFDELNNAHDVALVAMIETPAADFAGVFRKLEAFEKWDPAATSLGVIVADMRRLMREARS